MDSAAAQPIDQSHQPRHQTFIRSSRSAFNLRALADIKNVFHTIHPSHSHSHGSAPRRPGIPSFHKGPSILPSSALTPEPPHESSTFLSPPSSTNTFDYPDQTTSSPAQTDMMASPSIPSSSSYPRAMTPSPSPLGRSPSSPRPRNKEELISRVKAALFGSSNAPSRAPSADRVNGVGHMDGHGNGVMADGQGDGTWMISVGWENKESREKSEDDKVDIYVNAPTHTDTLIRTLGEIKDLDHQLKQNTTLATPSLPPVNPFRNMTDSPQPPSERHVGSIAATSTSSLNGSPSKKSRQGSFLSAFSNKMKASMRGGGPVNGHNTSPTKRPALRTRETEPKPTLSPPQALDGLLATPPPKRATIHLSDGEALGGFGLGQFDFENNKEEEKSDLAQSLSLLDLDTLRLSSPSPMESLTKELITPKVVKGEEQPLLSLEKATALVSAMAENSALATLASQPESSASPTGVPPTPLGAGTATPVKNGEVPSLSLTEALLGSPEELSDGSSGVRRSVEHDLVTSLSEYFSALANDPAIRAQSAWQAFMRPRSVDLTHRTERQERADWAANATELLARASPIETDGNGDAHGGDLTQRKKLLRRSRSLGSGIFSAFVGKKEEPSFDVVPSAEAPLDEKAEPEMIVNANEPESPVIEISAPAVPSTSAKPAPESIALPASPPTNEGDVEGPTENDAEEKLGHVKTRTSDAAVTASTTPNHSLTSNAETNPTSAGSAELSRDPSVVKRGRPGRKAVKVEDFELLKTLGRGCAGKVVLVKNKHTAALYAMKIIIKKHVIAHQELKHTLTEQSVLRRMSEEEEGAEGKNPFVVKLWYSFFDSDNLYLVLDFHPGGDLATQLSRWGRLGRDRARFYTSEIVEGVEGLHAAGVIYRDLKPENVLLGGDGHIVLVDFGLAAWFPGSKGPIAALPHWMGGGADEEALGRPGVDRRMSADATALMPHRDTAESFVGTAEYLAPEVIKGEAYDYAVDWWSLGTMLYEALMGSTPFWAENHADMYTRVVHEQLTFPDSTYLDKDTRSFIRGLLQKDPAFRLCEPRIKKHPYLSMVDFDHVRHKRYIPPYIPPTDSSLDFDTQNFDNQFLELSPALGADGPEEPDDDNDDSSKDAAKPEVVVDDDVFRGYIFKDRQIMSVFMTEDAAKQALGDLDGPAGYDVEAELASPDPAAEAAEERAPAEPQPGNDTTTPEPEVDQVNGDAPTPQPPTPATETSTATTGSSDALAEGEAPEDDEKTVEQQTVSAPTPALIQRIQSIASADHIRASNRHSRDFGGGAGGRASLEQLNRLASPLSKAEETIANLAPPDADNDDDWDLVDDHPDEEARNGNRVAETLFSRGVVDRYKLAILRRKESTVRKKQTSGLRKSPSSSLFFAGGPSASSSTGGFKSKLKLRAKSPKKSAGPPTTRGAVMSKVLGQSESAPITPQVGALSPTQTGSSHSLSSMGRPSSGRRPSRQEDSDDMVALNPVTTIGSEDGHRDKGPGEGVMALAEEEAGHAGRLVDTVDDKDI